MVPLYFQLAEYFRTEILNGSLKPGDMIPPENILVRKYQISRGTVRQAMGKLIQDGLVERYPGRGSFVSHTKLEHDANRYLGLFSQAMLSTGKKPSANVIDAGEITAPEIVQSQMKLSEKDTVVVVKRLRLVEGVPYAIETQYFRSDIGQKLLEENLCNSLYEILTMKFGLVLKRSKNSIESSFASDENARLLGINKMSPVLLIRRTMYASDERIIEYSIDIYRGDKNRFVIEDTYISEKITFGIES